MAIKHKQHATKINRDLKVRFAELVELEMKRRDMNVTAAAKHCGLFRSAMSRLLNPELKQVKFETITAVSAAFGYTPKVVFSKTVAATA